MSDTLTVLWSMNTAHFALILRLQLCEHIIGRNQLIAAIRGSFRDLAQYLRHCHIYRRE
jgi:hypothetical protein